MWTRWDSISNPFWLNFYLKTMIVWLCVICVKWKLLAIALFKKFLHTSAIFTFVFLNIGQIWIFNPHHTYHSTVNLRVPCFSASVSKLAPSVPISMKSHLSPQFGNKSNNEAVKSGGNFLTIPYQAKIVSRHLYQILWESFHIHDWQLTISGA